MEHLPLEIIEIICNECNTYGLFQLRLVSKYCLVYD